MNAAAELPPTPDFAQVYETCFDHVWLTLRRLGVVERELDDATHNVFVVVHRRLSDFDTERAVKPWLSGIAYRVAADERRRARHRREALGHPAMDLRASERPGPERALAARQARSLVHQALETLDLGQRAVFVMAELDGSSGPEIAAALEVPLNTVYSRLRAARQRFAATVRRLRLLEGT